MRTDGGFYLMHRGWMDSPALGGRREPFCRRAAWAWLIEAAAWQPTRVNIAGHTVQIGRGQLSYSLRFLGDAWGWGVMRVSRFISRLAEEAMIDTSTDTGQMVITICNYERYQALEKPTDTPRETRARQERDTGETNKNQGNQRNQEEIQKATPSVGDGLPLPNADLLSAATVLRMPPDAADAATGAWNAMARECGLSSVQKVTPARRAALRLRLRECGGLEGWRAALDQVRASAFLLGENDSGWKADFDFVLRAKSFTRLCEGAYGNRGRPKERSGSVAWMKKYLAPEPAAPGFDLDLTADSA